MRNVSTKLLPPVLFGLLAHCSGEAPISNDASRDGTDDDTPGAIDDSLSDSADLEQLYENEGFGMPAESDSSTAPSSPVAAGRWSAIADRAYQEGAAAESRMKAARKNVKPLWQAALAQYAGMKYGWQSPEFKARWNTVLSRRLPSRGWGLGEAWGQRTADTTYAITTAWHVGHLLLAAYDGGGVPDSYLYDAADALLDFPKVPGKKCIAYSSSKYDQSLWPPTTTRGRAFGLTPA